MLNKTTGYGILLLCTALYAGSCESQQQYFASPPGYDLTRPTVYKMPDQLKEISGIAFSKGANTMLYAEQDEEGKVFYFKLGDQATPTTRFANKGDFEDVSICNNYVIMLRSDGVLFTFPLSEIGKKNAANVKTFQGLLPDGEYEGLASIDSTGNLYVLCKHCRAEKTSKWGGGSILKLDTAGNLVPTGNFEIDIRQIEAMEGVRKIDFHPSALTHHASTKEWFILSGVNKMLVITDELWKVKSVYSLNPMIFPQPEGISVDNENNLYISNERNQAPTATILVFPYQKK